MSAFISTLHLAVFARGPDRPTDDSFSGTNKEKSLSTGNIAKTSQEERLKNGDKFSMKDQYLNHSRYITGHSSKKCMSSAHPVLSYLIWPNGASASDSDPKF